MKPMPLTAWADRAPAVRYPLLLVLIFVLWGLAGAVAPLG